MRRVKEVIKLAKSPIPHASTELWFVSSVGKTGGHPGPLALGDASYKAHLGVSSQEPLGIRQTEARQDFQ